MFFPLGEVKVKKKTAFLAGGIKKTIIIDKQLDGFLKEFGNRIIDNNNTSCKQIIEETISGGGDSKDFNTGRVKCCRYCNNVLWKDLVVNGQNTIICSSCDDKMICFKCLYYYHDDYIDHEQCIDSQDCDLYEKYGNDEVFVGKRRDSDTNDRGIENFKENKFFHPRRCFNCKGWGVKDRHCNHITCICGAQWCWFCGAPYDHNYWNSSFNCRNLHLAGLDSDSFDSSLNKKMKIHDDDLLPWERKKNKILKKQIQNFIKLGKNKLNKKNKKPIKQKGNDLLCCNCFLDCLDKIKNCFPDIYYLFSTKTLTLQIYASNLFIIFMHSSKVFK